MNASEHPAITIQTIERALQGPLPGEQAQQRMAPVPRSLRPTTPDIPPREGAVLALLYPHAGELHLALTRRSERLMDHRGQISLPGGRREQTDLTLWDTALRETHEELAVDPARVRYIGALTPLYIPASHYHVHPFVGYVPVRPTFVPNADEVAEIIELPLRVLLDPHAKRQETWNWQGKP
ncbi:MAG: CoA pyrophosphatase, partial [Chloroflexi bacterium]|nr:CoA pyrophosphatase [Chloroflexota bacterium]